MILTYKPDGADEQRWQFTLHDLMTAESETLERKTGWVYPVEFGQQLLKGSVIARRALLWVFLKRSDPALRYEQVDVQSGAIGVDYELEELQTIRNVAVADQEMSAAQRETTINALDELIAKEPEQAPKVPEPSGG